MLWSDARKIVPVDYRIYDPTRDGKTKNDHAKDMLDSAHKRAFKPKYVPMDSWYTSIDNLKAINKKGWKWIGALKHNRLVSLQQGAYVHVSELD